MPDMPMESGAALRPDIAGAAPQPQEAVAGNPKRKRLFAIFGALLAATAAGGFAYDKLVLSHYVSTDDAYVAVSSAQVTPLTGGIVLDVPVHNAQMVTKGDALLRIDPADAELQYRAAEANYRLTLRKVQTYFDNLRVCEANYERAKRDYQRRLHVEGTGAVSGEELFTAKSAYDAAAAALDAARAMTQGTDVAHHPEVLAAAAARDTAKLNLERTVVRAPVDGVVTQRMVQVGQRVEAGMPVMTVVPIADAYVEANFKEDQLALVHAGEKAEVTSDLYGSSVVFHGRVAGLSGGTGAAFAIIPAQNATGNWIKVVQRVPVRIDLDPRELKAHPLRVGLSMNATVDLKN